jgi:hypothetical protein
MEKSERCFNVKTLERLAAEASQRAAKARRSITASKPVAKDDTAKILGVAAANGCAEFGRLWVQRFGSDFASFRKALAWKLDHDRFVASLR